MSKYVIKIEGPNRLVTIECDSTFTLDVDLVEWVREEVDRNATFAFADKPQATAPGITAHACNVLCDQVAGYHATIPQPITAVVRMPDPKAWGVEEFGEE